jgi:hypothetical protein
VPAPYVNLVLGKIGSDRTEKGALMSQHVLYVGGEDHNLRIPVMLALRNQGFRVTAAGTGDAAPFAQAGVDYRHFSFDRFVNPLDDLAAITRIAKLLDEVRPDIVQSFDVKPSLLVPLAARRVGGVQVVRTINGRGFLYSSRSAMALSLRLFYRTLHWWAAHSTAATVFENSWTVAGAVARRAWARHVRGCYHRDAHDPAERYSDAA